MSSSVNFTNYQSQKRMGDIFLRKLSDEQREQIKWSKATRTAYKMWQSYAPNRDATHGCCRRRHLVKPAEKKLFPYTVYGKNDYFVDSEVCQRELWWRRYVRLRDDRPEFPFGREART